MAKETMHTMSNRPMPAATHRGCARAHTDAARQAWPGTGQMDVVARLRLADIVARVASWPDTLPPLCDAPLAHRARPDPVRYPYVVALTGAALVEPDVETTSLDNTEDEGDDDPNSVCDGQAETRGQTRFSAVAHPDDRHKSADKSDSDDKDEDEDNDSKNKEEKDDDDGMVLGWRHERVCEALWYYVRVILPELEMHPRSPGGADYDQPDRVRLMAFIDPASAEAGAAGPIMLAYGFATAWEAGARERTAAFLAARQRRRAHLSPRPLARTGWLSARGLKAAAGIPHPRLARDPSLARRPRHAVHRFDDDEGDDGDDEDTGFYAAAGKALRASHKAVRFHDDTDLARPFDRLRDPYDTYNTPAVLWHRHNPPSPVDGMQVEELDDSDDDDDNVRGVRWPLGKRL
ncbi:hypothetical protein pclt_cds_81 [Pandoravirus celtis]|uniref:Uncharacterized protein n=1 Tax=Pandoravirus celtis TaxID=2568002 RepID=A0A4D6EHC9_9VIRU|nr:hypothetical protein pclt_cds_81 [Pandoravirus celtis]